MNRPHSSAWLLDGKRVRGWLVDVWFELEFEKAWVDPGPSPMGNPGPYLKVPRIHEGEQYVHRVYPNTNRAFAMVLELTEQLSQGRAA